MSEEDISWILNTFSEKREKFDKIDEQRHEIQS